MTQKNLACSPWPMSNTISFKSEQGKNYLTQGKIHSYLMSPLVSFFTSSISLLSLLPSFFFPVVCSVFFSSLSLLFPIVHAAPLDSSDTSSSSFSSSSLSELGAVPDNVPGPGSLLATVLSANQIIVGTCFMVTGVLFLLLGKRFFKFSLALVGGYTFAWIAFLFLTFLNATFQLEITVPLYWGVTLVFALIGIGIAYFFYKVALFLAGSVAGFFLGTWLLSFGYNAGITSDAGRRAFIYILAFVMGVLVLFLESWLCVFILPWVGSYFLFLGIDVFAQTGFTTVFTMVISWYSSNRMEYSPDGKTYGMLVGFAITAILGILFQWRRKKN